MPRPMKNSGVKWIGDIPADWEINNVFQIFTQVKNKNSDLQEQNLLSLSYGKIKRKNIDTTDGLLPESFDGYNIIEADDIVLRLTDLQNDHKSLRVGLATERGIVTSAYLTIRNRSESLPKYLYYYLHSFDIAKGFYGMGAGVRQNLNWNEMKWLRILSPPLEEQKRIAAFLDDKCARIDSIVAKTRASVEEYKKLKQAVITRAVTKGLRPNRPMKDSGVEWLGDIPADWVLNKIKNSFTVYSGATPKSDVVENWDGDIIWITPADYKTADKYISQGKRNLSEIGYRSCGTTLVPSGSIIFSKRAPIGTVAIAVVELCTNQGCLACVPKAEADNGYYFYVMSAFTEQFNMFGTGTTFKEISYDVFRSFKVPHPPLDEQKEIAAYLDAKTSAIDSLVAKKNQLAAELASLKKSLIFEYVTGKKEVTA